MPKRNLLRLVWQGISAAGTLAWVLSLGVGSVVSAVLANSVGLDQPWQSVFFVGVLLLATSLTLPFAEGGIVSLRSVLPKTEARKSLTLRQAGEAYKDVERERLQKDDERKFHRALSLVGAELSGNTKQIEDAIKSKRYWPPRLPLRRTHWETFNEDLAGEASITVVYARIVDAYDEIDRLSNLVWERSTSQNDRPFIYEEQDGLDQAKSAIWYASRGIDECLGRVGPT